MPRYMTCKTLLLQHLIVWDVMTKHTGQRQLGPEAVNSQDSTRVTRRVILGSCNRTAPESAVC